MSAFGLAEQHGLPRIASVQALEASEVVCVNREGVLDYLREDPAFALSLLGKVMRRIRSTPGRWCGFLRRSCRRSCAGRPGLFWLTFGGL